MFQNRVLLLCLCFGVLGFSQNKKVSDTIYIYEEVIVHDTIFIEKPLQKMSINKVVVVPQKNGMKPQLILFQNDKKTTLLIDSLIVDSKKKLATKSWFFGLKTTFGANSNSLFKAFNSNLQPNFGLGVLVKKMLFNPNFSIGTGLEINYLPSSFSFDASTNNSNLNGFYFNQNHDPKLFNSLTNSGFQYQIPIQFYWKIKKLTPSIGVFGSISNYKSTFIGSSGSIPLIFDETQKYTAKTVYFGYLAQLNYKLNKKYSVGLNYSYGTSKNLIFKRNSNDTFAVSKKITQNGFGINFTYWF